MPALDAAMFEAEALTDSAQCALKNSTRIWLFAIPSCLIFHCLTEIPQSYSLLLLHTELRQSSLVGNVRKTGILRYSLHDSYTRDVPVYWTDSVHEHRL